MGRTKPPPSWAQAVDRFVADLVDRERSVHTRANYREDLQAFAGWYQHRFQDPPTLAELDRLRGACGVLGANLGPRLRDMLDFAAFTLMRPSELFELRYSDIDFERNRIRVSRRLYRGEIDVPKNGAAKTIALVPPAREILLRQPTYVHDTALVFVSQLGSRLCAQTLSRYWQRVVAAAHIDRDMPFYLASKHYGVSRLYELGLSERAIASQAGWSIRSVEHMLDVYGHRERAAFSEIQALYEDD